MFSTRNKLREQITDICFNNSVAPESMVDELESLFTKLLRVASIEAMISELKNVRDVWHDSDDEIFANKMNKRITELKLLDLDTNRLA